LQIIQGDKVIEIKSPDYNKGSEVSRQLKKEYYDFILAIGDDTTDDDMFAALPPRALSIKIGNASEHARYNMPEQSEVVPLLELLARDRGSFDPAGVKHAIRTTWNNLKKLVAGRRTEEYGQ
jgi:trehalose 6-phosphate synthase/phosphatase